MKAVSRQARAYRRSQPAGPSSPADEIPPRDDIAQGFRAMWIVCAGAALTSLIFVGKLQRAEDDRRHLADE